MFCFNWYTSIMENTVDVRPWGRYEVLLDTEYTKVKLITVEPRKRLSYQSHKKRQEQWVLVKGKLTIVCNDIEFQLDNEGDYFNIPLGSNHRAWNQTDEVCEFVEVQTGTYFGVDDITRIQDDYNRK